MGMYSENKAGFGHLLFFCFVLLQVCFDPFPSPWAASEAAEGQALETLLAMSLEELIEVEVTVATGTAKPLKLAPAIASVITAADIKNMGATTLAEALETVPGLHIAPSQLNRLDDVISIRGIHTGANPHVLFLFNGLPFTQSWLGGRPFTFTMPVANVSRIEIIRGPGSSVYGADAFAGTINIITKDGKEIDGFDFGLRYGSFETKDLWLLHGGHYKGWDVSFSLEYQDTDGDDSRIIESDLQSTLDETINAPSNLPPASRAPAPLVTDSKIIDAQLAAQNENWTIRLWGWFQDHAGLGAGGSQIIDTEGFTDVEQYFADVQYKTGRIHEDWELVFRASFLYREEDSYFVLFPPGTVLPIGADGNVDFLTPAGTSLFTDGYIGNPILKESQTTVEGTAYYKGFANHLLRSSLGYKFFKQDHEHYSNFGPSVIDGSQPVVDGTLTDLTDNQYSFVPDVDREIAFVSLQDEWSFAEKWQLTAGIRYDHYSDFGDTFNPRLALVWEPFSSLTTKLLYGRAFRPPSFSELYAENNPVILGNPDLQAETINTFELAFDYRATDKLRFVPSVFFYQIDDLIDYVPDPGLSTTTAQNARDQEGYGFELEVQAFPMESFFVKGYLAYQDSEDEATGEPVPNAPQWQAFVNANWRFLPDWSLDGQYFWVGRRERVPGDMREDIKDNDIVNVTLRRTNMMQNWEVALAVRNLFDENVREPSTSSIPDDYPMEKRSFWAELRCHF